jgi:hypothetical protein
MPSAEEDCTGSCIWKWDAGDASFSLTKNGCDAGTACKCLNPNGLNIRLAVQGQEVETPCIIPPTT